MSFSNQSIDARLAASQLALTNTTSNPEIGAMLAEYGYDAARLATGQALYETALLARSLKSKNMGSSTLPPKNSMQPSKRQIKPIPGC